MTSVAYHHGSLAAVLPAAAGALGVDLDTATGLRSRECRNALGLPEATRVLVVLVDGLGYHNIVERAGHARFLRSELPRVRQLSTCFPSTTSAALATLGTGTSPGLAGLVGYTQRNPLNHSLLTTVSWKEQPRRPGAPARNFDVPAGEVQREPTIFERLGAAGQDVTMLGLAKFEGSGLTQAALRGARFVTVPRVDDRADAVIAALRAPGLCYLYWGELDATGHRHGPASAQWGEELERFDRFLAGLARRVARGTLVLVTADHGQVSADPNARIDVAETASLAEGVDIVGGEPRALHVYAESGAADDVGARWRAFLGERAIVLARDEAVAAGWFGPVAEHVRPWLGDVIVAARGRMTIVDSRVHTPEGMSLPGVHGSFTEQEMTIPFLALDG